jgi:hypothetical protein
MVVSWFHFLANMLGCILKLAVLLTAAAVQTTNLPDGQHTNTLRISGQ